MDEYLEQWIAKEKEDIIAKLKGQCLFGERIDLDNTDMVIVAAYYAGWQKAFSMKHGPIQEEIHNG